jgi:hypothetical protein
VLTISALGRFETIHIILTERADAIEATHLEKQ